MGDGLHSIPPFDDFPDNDIEAMAANDASPKGPGTTTKVTLYFRRPRWPTLHDQSLIHASEHVVLLKNGDIVAAGGIDQPYDAVATVFVDPKDARRFFQGLHPLAAFNLGDWEKTKADWIGTREKEEAELQHETEAAVKLMKKRQPAEYEKAASLYEAILR
jgi:hypothetical protein